MNTEAAEFYIIKFLTELFVLPIWRLFDLIIPKKSNYWAFTVHHIKSELFVENQRAVFECIKKHSDIKKVIFVRSDSYDFAIDEANNVEYVNIKSIRGLWLFARCKVVFVSHSISMDYSMRWGANLFSVIKPSFKLHRVINLWHGIPFKKLYALWNPEVKKRLDRVKFRAYERTQYAGLISSSTIDSYAMATMFYPIKYENVWITGLPKNDFLLMEQSKLPAYFRNQVEKIKAVKGSKRLITYAPTYRQSVAVTDSKYYQFSFDEITELKALLEKHNAVFGFRMHYFRNAPNLFNMEDFVDNEYIFDLGHSNISEVSVVLRETDLLVSDYSSVFIEALYVSKPIFNFTYDLEHYRDNQDGLLYELEMILPSPPIFTFKNLLREIEKELTNSNQVNTDKYKFAQRFFFNYIDSNNAGRVFKLAEKEAGID